jgi:hypothetical protein
MKEILLSIYDTMKQRFKSPFIGAYVVSFFVYNWWPVSIYLRSDKKIEDIVKHLTKEYSNGLAYLVPLLFAVIYVAALPYINAFFDLIGTKANLFRIRNRNEVKHEGLLQDIKTAEYERKIADERAGTKEKETLLLKLDTAEANLEKIKVNWTEEKKLFQVQQEELAVKINERSNEVLKLKNDIAVLENQRKSTEAQFDFFQRVYPHLIKIGKSAQIETTHFLRKYLNESEVIKLKENLNSLHVFTNLPYREEVNALLIHSGVYAVDEKTGNFYLTEAGVRFIKNML